MVLNQLSQLTSETRTFTGVGSFQLSYEYNLAGELKKLTDHTGMAINYGYDTAGRVNGISGSGTLYSGVSQYASGFAYRAWNGLKQMTDGTNHVASLTYNARLQTAQYQLSGGAVTQTFDYYNDGRIKFLHNSPDFNFDRSYTYDHLGRLKTNVTGGVARNDYGDVPYLESFNYDAFSNLTQRSTDTWNLNENISDTATYANNRRSDFAYDAEGRNTGIGTRSYSFDAAGAMAQMQGQQWLINHYITATMSAAYDGDGFKAKEVTTGTVNATTYYVRSTVLGGQIIEEINSSGQKAVGYVYYPGGGQLARQNGSVTWIHNAPANTSRYEAVGSNVTRTEFDPLGADVPLSGPPQSDTGGGLGDIGGNHFAGILDNRYSNMFDTSGGCMIDFVPAPCNAAMGLVNNLDGIVTDPYETPRTGGVYDPLTERFVGVAIFGQNPNTGGFQYSYRRIVGYDYNENWEDGSDMWREVWGIESIPQNPSQRPLTTDEIGKLRSDLNAFLKGNCATFIKGVLTELGKLPNGVYSTDLMTIFEAVITQPGGGLFSDPTIKSPAVANAFGSFTGGNAQIAFKSGPTAANAAHETMHVAAKTGFGYGHIEMAQAAYRSATAMGLTVLQKLPQERDYKTWKAFDSASSNYFSQALFDACLRVQPWQPPPSPRKP